MIDISRWKEFNCIDLFECKNTGNILTRNIEDGSGNTPYVTASAYNNGVVAHIDASKYDIIKGNCILVGGKTFTITYQKEDFVSNDSHNFVIRVKNIEIGELEYLYLVAVIYNYFEQKYSWNDAVTKDKFLKERIPLPVNNDNQLDWDYMKSYMQVLTKNAKENINTLKKVNVTKCHIDINKWEEFHIYDLFDIKTGTALDKSKMTENNPEIRLIGRIGFNNGLSKMVDRKDNIVPFKKGDISLALGGAYLGACFIQPGDFYTGEHMVALIAKNEMTFFQKLFITTIITKTARIKYRAFVDEMDSHIRNDFSFKLPVLEPHNPDYQYMETYMKSIMQKSETIITSLNS